MMNQQRFIQEITDSTKKQVISSVPSSDDTEKKITSEFISVDGMAIPADLSKLFEEKGNSPINNSNNVVINDEPSVPRLTGVADIPTYKMDGKEVLQSILNHKHLQAPTPCDEGPPSVLNSLLRTPTASERLEEKLRDKRYCEKKVDVMQTTVDIPYKVSQADAVVNLRRVAQILEETKPTLDLPRVVHKNNEDCDRMPLSYREYSAEIDDMSYSSHNTDYSRPVTPELSPYPPYDEHEDYTSISHSDCIQSDTEESHEDSYLSTPVSVVRTY